VNKLQPYHLPPRPRQAYSIFGQRLSIEKRTALLKGVPDSISSEDLESAIPGLVIAVQIRFSRAFQLQFPDFTALDSAITSGLVLDMRSFVFNLKKIPRRRLRCQSAAYMIAS